VGIKIDLEKCIGCGLCASMCPEVFELRDDGKSYVIRPEGCEEHDLKEIAEMCAVEAITIQ
jgi:ferredoxin